MPKSPRLSKKFSKPLLSRLINGDISPTTTPDKPQTTRLDLYLVEKYPNYNRNTLKKFIKDGSVTVNGEVITKPNFQIFGTESIHLSEPSITPLEKPNLPIIYEDDNVLVLDKPAGMLSMSKGDYNPEPTIEDYGLLVHRLDRGTSGVIILAKNESAKTHLQKQFQSRRAHKTYYAIVVGHPEPSHAIINIPLARNLARPTTFQPREDGREAITEYEVVDQTDQYSLLRLSPTTGRTHQLRVHLKHIGTPILGDTVYDAPPANRLYLHATSLEITIPDSLRKTFTSPIPEEFTNVFKQS